jgi:hypothetical protein
VRATRRIDRAPDLVALHAGHKVSGDSRAVDFFHCKRGMITLSLGFLFNFLFWILQQKKAPLAYGQIKNKGFPCFLFLIFYCF